MLQQDRFGSDNFDYLLYQLNHYSPLLQLDDVILTTVREARTAFLSSQEQSSVDFSSAYKASVAFSGVPGRSSYVISREHLLFSLIIDCSAFRCVTVNCDKKVASIWIVCFCKLCCDN